MCGPHTQGITSSTAAAQVAFVDRDPGSDGLAWLTCHAAVRLSLAAAQLAVQGRDLLAEHSAVHMRQASALGGSWRCAGTHLRRCPTPRFTPSWVCRAEDVPPSTEPPAKRKRRAPAGTGRKKATAPAGGSDSDSGDVNDENDPGAGNRETRSERAARRGAWGGSRALSAGWGQAPGGCARALPAEAPCAVEGGCMVLRQTCTPGQPGRPARVRRVGQGSQSPAQRAGQPAAEPDADTEMEEAVDLPRVAAAIAAFMRQREFAGSCTLEEVAAHLRLAGTPLALPALRQVGAAAVLP